MILEQYENYTSDQLKSKCEGNVYIRKIKDYIKSYFSKKNIYNSKFKKLQYNLSLYTNYILFILLV